MGKIYKRGATYWAYWITETGERKRATLHTKDKDAARDRLKNLERGLPAVPPQADAVSGGLSKAAATPLHEAFTSFLTRKIEKTGTLHSYTIKIRHLETLLGKTTPIGAITSQDLEAYVEKRLASVKKLAESDGGGTKKIHPSTVYKELVVLRGTLKHLKLSTEHVPKVAQKYVPRKTWLSMDDLEVLIGALPPERRAWVALAGYAGCRSSEVERVTQACIRGDGMIHVGGTKTLGSDRPVPISPPLIPYLDELPVQPWRNVRRDLRKICDENGLQRVSPNDLRRTFASRLAQQGIPLFTIAVILGHKSTRMVEQVYSRLAPKTLIDAVTKAFGGVGARARAKRPTPPIVKPGKVAARKTKKPSSPSKKSRK